MAKSKKQRKVRTAPQEVKDTPGIPRFLEPILALSVLAVTVFVFYPCLSAEFVSWDDPRVIIDNPFIRSFSPFSLKWMFTTFHSGNYIPFTWLTHAAVYHFWKLDAGMHHLVNVIFHGLNSLLLFFVFRKILTLVKQKYALFTAAIASVLWSINPTHVESVAWVSELKDVSCTFFFLLSVLIYLRYASESAKKARLFILTCVSFIVSLLFKPMSITFPAVILLLDVWPLRRFDRRGDIKPVLIEKVPFFAVSFLFCIIAFVSQASVGAVAAVEGLPFSFRIMNAFHSVIFYLKKTAVPVGLVPYYPIVNPTQTAFAFKNVISLVLVILISFMCAVFGRKRRIYLSVAWLFYIVTLLPILGIVQIGGQAAADRYTYIPSMSIVLLLTAWIVAVQARLEEKYGLIALFKPALIMLVIVSVIFGSLTIKQIDVWRNSLSLWEYCARAFPNVSRKIHINLGMVYKNMGRHDEAIEMLKKAIEISPNYAKPYSNLGYEYAELGRYQEAMDLYRKALEVDPDYVETYINFGNTYLMMGKYNEAISMFEKALEVNPNYIDAYNNLGNIYCTLKKYEEGIRLYKKAIEMNPYNTYAYTNLGNAYSTIGKKKEAIASYHKAIRIDPTDARVYYNLGCTYRDMGRRKEAIEFFKKTLKLDPKHANTYVGLAVEYYEEGRYGLARECYSRAIRLGIRPDRRFLDAINAANTH